MNSQDVIDAQFDRAVEIVQGLPKTGPIQTSYEEKLTMYSLYKQATVGNVKSPRPGIWDMLGRAKWDAWAKHKDLDPYEAKWLYVEALLKVLRKYSDKTVARDLVQELESFGGHISNSFLSHSMSRSEGSSSSGSTASLDDLRYSQRKFPPSAAEPSYASVEGVDHNLVSPTHDESEDEARALPRIHDSSQFMRPQSSMSSRYRRTPLIGSLTGASPLPHGVPAMQPLPGFETQSAFGEPIPSGIPSALYPGTMSNPGQYTPGRELASQHMYSGLPHSGAPIPHNFHQRGIPSRPTSHTPLEQALENMQGHLAALNERLETLESISTQQHRSTTSLVTSGVPPKHSLNDKRFDRHQWNLDDLGMWSLVLKPLSQIVFSLKYLMLFFASNESRSPMLVVIRRLFLDVSFILAVLAILRTAWGRNSVRRREIKAALKGLWHAMTGLRADRDV